MFFDKTNLFAGKEIIPIFVDISRYNMKRIPTLILVLWSAVSSFGHTEVQPDSIAAGADSVGIISPGLPEPVPLTGDLTPGLPEYPAPPAPLLMFSGNSYSGLNGVYFAPQIHRFTSSSSPLPQWMFFTSDEQTFPGLMQIQSGSVGFAATAGNFGYGAHAGAIKYGSFNSLVTSYYIGGEMSYRISPTVSMTVFGSYYSRNPYLGMAASPFVQTTGFGGYVTLTPSSAFSLSLGARSYYDPLRRRFETDPIIAPTVKVGIVKISVDFGHVAKECLSELFRSWSR